MSVLGISTIMSKFYNYDTRGASAASQIITLERMLESRDNEIAQLRAHSEQDEAVIRVWRGRTLRAEEQRDILVEALQSIARNATTVSADAWCGDIARAALEEIKESE